MIWDKVNLYFLKGLLDVHFPAIKLRVTNPKEKAPSQDMN
jgi:hypothetical protein